MQAFRKDWQDLVRVQVSETVVDQADNFARRFDLRGYDAVQLAAASIWQETMSEQVTLATFDELLWRASDKVGLVPFPADLPKLLKQQKPTKSARP